MAGLSENIIVAIITGIITLIGAFLMALPGIRAFRDAQKKSKAEAVKIEAEASKIFSDLATESIQREKESMQRELKRSEELSMLQERVNLLERNFKELISILCSWAGGIDSLIAQIEKKEEVPNWKPRVDDLERVTALKDSVKTRTQ